MGLMYKEKGDLLNEELTTTSAPMFPPSVIVYGSQQLLKIFKIKNKLEKGRNRKDLKLQIKNTCSFMNCTIIY